LKLAQVEFIEILRGIFLGRRVVHVVGAGSGPRCLLGRGGL
jgi:hypothetical protein